MFFFFFSNLHRPPLLSVFGYEYIYARYFDCLFLSQCNFLFESENKIKKRWNRREEKQKKIKTIDWNSSGENSVSKTYSLSISSHVNVSCVCLHSLVCERAVLIDPRQFVRQK